MHYLPAIAAARLGRKREGTFLEYMGERVEEGLIWSHMKELCRNLAPRKKAGWDGVAPRVVKGVAGELSGPLSRLFNCCIQGGHYSGCFKVGRVVPTFQGEEPHQFCQLTGSLGPAHS